MARGKHSTALFEVINSGKKSPSGLKSANGKPFEAKAAAASLMRTPKWWFKGRPNQDKKPDAAPAHAAVGDDPTANVTAATLTARSQGTPSAASPPWKAATGSTSSPQAGSTGSTSSPQASSPSSPQASSPLAGSAPVVLGQARSTNSGPATARPVAVIAAPEPAEEALVVVRDYSEPEPILADQVFDPEPEEEPVLSISQPDPPTAPSAGPIFKTWALMSRHREGALTRTAAYFGVDRDRQEITLRMRYTTAIVSAFVVLVVIASAYVIGRHLGESALTPGASATNPHYSTRDVKTGPAQPGVLDVGRDRAHLASAKIDGGPSPAAKMADPDAFEDAPMDTAGIAYRTVNRNYVIIATFPPDRGDSASKACDFLCAHGITCTLERDVHGEPLHWLSVVGIRGFPHSYSKNKDYLAYRDAILALNDKYPAKSSFGRFTVMPYKWDGN